MSREHLQLIGYYVLIRGSGDREWREFWKDYPEQIKEANHFQREFIWRVMYPSRVTPA